LQDGRELTYERIMQESAGASLGEDIRGFGESSSRGCSVVEKPIRTAAARHDGQPTSQAPPARGAGPQPPGNPAQPYAASLDAEFSTR